MQDTGEQRLEGTGRILVVDDDQQLRLLVVRFLQRHGYDAIAAEDGIVALSYLETKTVDLVVLDLMLPERNGIEICADIRTVSNVPIIMLTARPEDELRISGLERGADDYMTKPFNPRELLARIRAQIRRFRHLGETGARSRAAILTFEGWQLDTGKRELVSPHGVLVDLSTGEYNLLLVFLENANRVVSREKLFEQAKLKVADAFDRAIDVQISRLRKKLETGHPGALIKTVRGQGYSLVVPVTTASNT